MSEGMWVMTGGSVVVVMLGCAFLVWCCLVMSSRGGD